MILSVPSHGLLILWALGKLLFCEKKSILVAETAPLLPFLLIWSRQVANTHTGPGRSL